MKRKYQKLRDSARGEECTLRINDVCNWNPETVVLCHLSSGSGMGQKSPDWFAVYGCSACHDVLDRRKYTNIPEAHFDEYRIDALYRTWERMIEKGLINV